VPAGAFALVTDDEVSRLLPMGDRDKDAEILALRQVIVLERHLHGDRVRFPGRTGRGWPPCCTRYRAAC
jgi:hypothetical protein